MTHQQRQTRKVELVETHNLALSLQRLREVGYLEDALRRALYHALCMTSAFDHNTRQQIRQAMKLP
jgi:hypothetical protein